MLLAIMVFLNAKATQNCCIVHFNSQVQFLKNACFYQILMRMASTWNCSATKHW